MPRILKLMDRPGYPNKCGYRHRCKGKAEYEYGVPFVNRYGNEKWRTTTVCRECAEAIKGKYPVETY